MGIIFGKKVVHSSQFTVHSSQFTVHSSQFTGDDLFGGVGVNEFLSSLFTCHMNSGAPHLDFEMWERRKQMW